MIKNQKKKPNVVFFSRSYQAKLFPLLKSDKYNSVHVTLTKKEKLSLEEKGIENVYCFELYNNYSEIPVSNYLETSFLSDRFLNRYKSDYRISLLKKEISFWNTVFDKYEPIAVINEQVAIEVAEVMYLEAKKRGILYKAWMSNPLNGYFYWTSNPMSLSLDKKIFEVEPSPASIEKAEMYIKNVIEKYERPYYLNPFLNVTKYQSFLSSVKGVIKVYIKKYIGNSENNLYENNNPAVYNAFERSFKVLYLKYDEINKLNKYEIILYPLHYEPEASLSYLSEFFSNQVALIENISKCLKSNQVLVVKEHPAQMGMLLTKKYRTLVKKTSNLYFLPSTMLSFEIIKRAKLIITLTSHLGWEALLFGKPVYLLGKMFYDKYPFVNKFESWEQLRQSIRNENYRYPDKKSILKYAAQLLQISYKGSPFPGSNLYANSNIDRIIYSIERELKLFKEDQR
jgi:Capsule polysaccharide biosynthesis protein